MTIIAAGAGIAVVYIISQVKVFRNLNLRDAAEAFSKGESFRARNILKKIKDEDPNNTLVLWYMARANLDLNSFEDAATDFESISRMNKYEVTAEDMPGMGEFTELEVNKKLKLIYEKLNSDEPLFVVLQKLSQLESENEEYPLAIAQSLARKQEFGDRTLKFLNKAIEINPSSVDALSLIAMVYFKKGKTDDAERFARRALDENENLVDTHYVLGEVALQRNNLEEAKAHLLKADASVYYRKSSSYAMCKIFSQQEKWEEAADYGARADGLPISKQEPENLEWDCKYQLGRIYESMNDPKNALAVYQTIDKFKSGYRDVKQRLQKFSSDDVEETDNIKDFQTAPRETFSAICEGIMRGLGHKVEKVIVTNDGNMNMLTREGSIDPQLVAVFIRRNYDVIQEDQPRLLQKYKETTRATAALLMTTGSISEAAKKFCESSSIKMYNGDQMEVLIDKAAKPVYSQE